MRARFIIEKFNEKSDPVSDMGIGGFVPSEVYRQIQEEAAEKWYKLISDSIIGKRVKGVMMCHDKRGHSWEEFEIIVAKLLNTFYQNGFSAELYIEDVEGKQYTILSDENLKVYEA